jgi:hypothetical protein
METIRNIAQAKALACIDHKSLEICGSMQALAADFSGYAEDSAAVFRDKSSNRLFGFPHFNNRS